MRKLLLSSAALALLSGGAFAQQVTTSSPFTVTLGGSIRSDFAFFDEDISNVNRESRLDARLFVKAEAKADNGLTYGFSNRIRTAGSGGNNMIMDYKYIYAKGSWGTVNLGDYQGASTQLEVVAPTVGIGQVDYAAFTNAGAAGLFWATEDTPDTKVTYLTPSFSGFQAGISYTPEKDDSGRGIRKTGTRYHDVTEAAAKYSNTFGAVGVTVGGGYEIGAESRLPADAALGDYQIWYLGAKVSYAGFTFGGNYYDNGETALNPGDDQDGWAVGLTYATGPFGVGASYARANTKTGGVKFEDQIWGVGGAYRLAPGLSLQSDINYVDAESDTNSTATGVQDNKAWQLVLRTRVDF